MRDLYGALGFKVKKKKLGKFREFSNTVLIRFMSKTGFIIQILNYYAAKADNITCRNFCGISKDIPASIPLAPVFPAKVPLDY